MPKKTITIFITTFVIVGILILGVYFWLTKDKTISSTNSTPWYQEFNPFGTGSNITTTNNPDAGIVTTQDGGQDLSNTESSRFSKITDFAVAGATFLEDTRPIVKKDGEETETQPEQVKTIISPLTKEGRKEIQIFLNKTLSINPPLKEDGNFGKLTLGAIGDFQKLNGLKVTKTIDKETSPFFTKTTDVINSVLTNQEEMAPSIRFVGRMNGHMYKMFLDTKIQEKISNSTIPGIYEAFFNNKADTVIYRYLSQEKIISTFLATLGAAKGEFLPQNISDLSISKDGTEYFYLTETSSGVTGVIGSFAGTQKNYVFNSPFTEWLSQWTNNKQLFLTTKASYGAEGSIFLLNSINKTITKVFGGISGLTTLVSPNSLNILYSESTETGPKLNSFNIARYSTKDLNSYGLPEKCVWSNDGINIYCAIPSVITGNQYPDIWYQGLVSFDDYFVKINTTTGERTTIASSVEETPVDGTHLFLNKGEDTLFFINKKDSTLWSLNIK